MGCYPRCSREHIGSCNPRAVACFCNLSVGTEPAKLNIRDIKIIGTQKPSYKGEWMNSDLLTWIGTVLTTIGTLVTLWQAGKVKKYKDQVSFDLRKLSISEAGEILRRGQEDCRKLLKSGSRGQNTANVCDLVQEKLDQALNRFNQKGRDQDIKNKIISANSLLHEIRSGQDVNNKSGELHIIFQEAVLLCNERLMEIH